MDRYNDVIKEIKLVKSDENLSIDAIDEKVSSLLGQYKYPLKEGLELVSCFGKCYKNEG